MLKRHPPDQYGQRWELPASYPARGAELFRGVLDAGEKIGLGRKALTPTAGISSLVLNLASQLSADRPACDREPPGAAMAIAEAHTRRETGAR